MASIKSWKSGYSSDACVKPNSFARWGVSLYDATDDGFGLLMGLLFTITLAFLGGFGGGGALYADGHQFWGWLVFTICLIPAMANIAAVSAIGYAKTTAIRGVRWSALDDAQDVYYTLNKSERQIVQPLMDKMYENVNNGARFDERLKKFNQLVSELETHKHDEDDKSDIMVADEMLKLLRQTRQIESAK